MKKQFVRTQGPVHAATQVFSTSNKWLEFIRVKSFSILVLAVLALSACVCRSQTTTATVTGEVTDATGAVVPSAAVSLTNVNTGIVTKIDTSNDGRYRISGLVPGTYKAEITKQGFKNIVKDNIQLHIEDVAVINYTMQVGSVSENVVIEAGAPLIETQSTSLGTTIEGRQVQDAPLNGRNAMNLIALVPGVVPQGSTSGTAAFNQSGNTNYTPAASGNYQISGAIAGWNATFVDGANVNAAASNQQALVPTQDSTSEFRVDTNSVSPQYGRFAGGVINFSTRSGTNDFHGTLYEYVRNTIFNANNFYNSPTRLAAPTPVLHMNQYGATLGGPIKRNKAFFFFSWESFHSAVTTLISSRVPTPAEMSGDFSADAPIWDAKEARAANGCGTGAGNGPINTICPADLDPTVQAFYNAKPRPYWQTIEQNPTRLATLMANGYNVSVNGKKDLPAAQYVIRGDYQLTDKQRLFARYTLWDIDVSTTFPVTAPAFPGGPVHVSVKQGVIGDDYTITQTLFANVRLAFIRYMYNNVGAGDGNYNLTQFGTAWGTIGSQLPFKAPPNIIRTSWTNAPSPAIDIDIHNFNDNYSASLGMTKVQGRHTIMFGGEYRRIETYGSNSQSPGGSLYFAPYTTTAVVNKAIGGIANLVEGMLTSNPSGEILTNVTRPSAYNFYQGLYITDTWQAKPNLTVNAGVRWEQPGAWMERRDRDTVLLTDKASPLGSIVNPVPGGPTALKGELALVNSPDYPSRKQTDMHLRLFEPRLGLSYAWKQNTVIRAGFALAHPCLECMSATTLPQNSPVNAATTQIQVPSGGYTSVSNPFPNGIFQPTGRNTNIMSPYSSFKQTLIGGTVSGQIPHGAFPYVMQWNLNLQRSIGTSTSLLISYSGNRGVHLGAFDINLNQLPDQYDSLGATLTTKVANPLSGIASPSGSVGAATANYGQFLMPYPQFTRLNAAGLNYGESTYHALITSLRKRFGSSFANASYTWSHTISNIDGTTGNLDAGSGQAGSGVQVQDFTNLRAERSNSAEDIRQRLVVEYVLDLPLGKGRRFLTTANSLVDHLVSGWGLNGITTIQTGLPISLSTSSTNTLTSQLGAGTLRPLVVAGVPKKGTGSRYTRTLKGNTWFNTAAFTTPGSFQFGNESRVDSVLRNDFVHNWDMGLTKTTKIRERFSLQFRAEYFNVFNRPQFGMNTQSSTQVGNANLGVFDVQANSPRAGQFSLRLNY